MEEKYSSIVKTVADMSLVLSNIEYLLQHDNEEKDSKLRSQYELLEHFTSKLETLSVGVEVEELKLLLDYTKSHLMTRRYIYTTGQKVSTLHH